MHRLLLMLLVVAATSAFTKAIQAEYNHSAQLFSTAPSPEASVSTMTNFGPAGMSLDLVKPNFTMRAGKIEPGSPAELAGLTTGQYIHTINGQKPTDLDPRIFLGNLITEAEAKDGKLVCMVADTPDGEAKEVVIQLPVLGAFSETWPLNCEKSEKIVRNFAEYLKSPGANKGFADIGMLFLLSTGDEDDLKFVGEWARGKGTGAINTTHAWSMGYGGLALCEYYLRTGDQAVMPKIQMLVDAALERETFGGWSGRWYLAHVSYGGGGGHLNAGGTLVAGFLMLAKECGADIPGETLDRIIRHWYRWAGRGGNSYGNGRPEVSLVDNGKNGKLAFAMAAAASLTPEGEDSIYARARDTAAMTSFYTTTHMLHGHTGGGIGEIWRSAAMGLLHETKPKQYRSFMDERRWHYEMSRRHDGSFAILGGSRYDNPTWGAGYALTFTVPRKTLRLTGAPPTKFSKPYKLPERPWGTEADDVFVSLEPAVMPDGKRVDVSNEIVPLDSGRPLIWHRMNVEGGVSDDFLRRYLHHPDFYVRRLAARNAAGFHADYMYNRGGAKVRPQLLNEFLQSNDPRVRFAAVSAIRDGMGDTFTQEAFDLVVNMIKDQAESWYVKDAAMQLVGRAPADWIVPHVDAIIPYLKHEEWWLQNAAATALSPVAADERVYDKVLPAMGEFVRTCQIFNATAPVRSGAFINSLRTASPKVAALARETLRETYTNYIALDSPITEVENKVNDAQRKTIVQAITVLPGGYDLLFELGKKQYPNDALPYASFFLSADPSNFGPDLKEAVTEIVRTKLIYEYMGLRRRGLLAEADAMVQSPTPGNLKGLVALYNKCGIDDYDWKPFGPDLYNATWNYHTFDPIEKQEFDASPWRYREVTVPEGMEEWFKPGFDPKKAGWKQGQLPIGQYKGKLVTDQPRCGASQCKCKDPMRSLWEKETLLLTGTFKFPKLKEGHLYRIRTGIGMHVGSGDGRKIYINGKELYETKAGNGRGAGGRPSGALITKDFIEEFNKGEVTISVITFLRYGNKARVVMPPVPQGILSLWIEEMEVPPLDDASFEKSATLIPFRSSEWQAKQGPDFADIPSESVMFRYDGKFVPNPKLLGDWTAVARVATIDAFDPAKPVNANHAWLKQIRFANNGKTSQGGLSWSGDRLMDLNKQQALEMHIKQVDGKDYLFIEFGGFDARHGPDWNTPLMVYQRKAS